MKTWSLSGRLAIWSATFFSTLLLVLAVAVAVIAMLKQVSALDIRLADQGARFFHEWREREGVAPAPRAADALKQLHFIGGMRVVSSDGRFLYANSAAAAALPECPIDTDAFSRLGTERVRIGTFDENEGVRVTLATSLEPVTAVAGDVLLAFAIALPVLGVVVYFGSRWLGRRTLAPVVSIIATAERLNARQLAERLAVPDGPDEIARLSAVLNSLFDRLAEGLDQSRRFTADAAHELRTPLSILQAGLEELLARPDLVPEVRREIDSLIDDHQRLATICEQLLLLSRSDAGQLPLDLQPVDLVDLTNATIEDASSIAETRRIKVEWELPESATCLGNVIYLGQILLNLLVNAVKYNCDEGRVLVQLHRKDEKWILVVGNTGVGISDDEAPHIFKRFYRSSGARARGGNGLGLSLSRELARAHGGELSLLKSANGWTEFQLVLNVVDPLPFAADNRAEKVPRSVTQIEDGHPAPLPATRFAGQDVGLN